MQGQGLQDLLWTRQLRARGRGKHGTCCGVTGGATMRQRRLNGMRILGRAPLVIHQLANPSRLRGFGVPIEFETGKPQRVEQHGMAAPLVERDVQRPRIEGGGLVRYGSCNKRGASFRNSQPQAVVRADLGTDVRDDFASGVVKRRGDAAILRAAGFKLAGERLFPSTRVLGWGGR